MTHLINEVMELSDQVYIQNEKLYNPNICLCKPIWIKMGAYIWCYDQGESKFQNGGYTGVLILLKWGKKTKDICINSNNKIQEAMTTSY